MPDWEELVHAHLDGLDLDAGQRKEIAAELAGHLEERFGDLRRRGVSESEAMRCSLDEIPNWSRLRRHLRRAALKEDAMNCNAQSLWIPGLSMLAFWLAASVGVLRAEMFPEGFVVNSVASLLIYVPWLAAFPAIGALGAYWSRRVGGSRAARLGVCLFPVAALIVMFMIAAVPDVSRVLWDPRLHFMAARVLRYREICALHWVMYPCLALLVGALPFLKGDAGRTIRPVEVQN
jgi:hypothetical protein